jgi:hypothetical protein
MAKAFCFRFASASWVQRFCSSARCLDVIAAARVGSVAFCVSCAEGLLSVPHWHLNMLKKTKVKSQRANIGY